MKELIEKKNKLRMDAMRLREVKFEKSIKNSHSMELNKEQDFETEYKEDMLNMLDDIGNILGEKE